MYIPWSVILIVSPLLLFGIGVALVFVVISSIAIANFLFPRRVNDSH